MPTQVKNINPKSRPSNVQNMVSKDVADKALLQARFKAHKPFDLLWNKRMEFFNIKQSHARNDGYLWLSKMLKISRAKCHMSQMDIPTCEKVTKISILTLSLWSQVTHEKKSSNSKVMAKPNIKSQYRNLQINNTSCAMVVNQKNYQENFSTNKQSVVRKRRKRSMQKLTA